MKRSILSLTGIFTFILISTMNLKAQPSATDVSDDELESFMAVQQEVQVISSKTQQKMVKAVRDEGLNVQKYNQIDRALQQPNAEPSASEEEMKKYESANEKVEELYTEIQRKTQQEVQEEGLTMKRYEEIRLAVQQDPELQQKAQEIIGN